MFRALAIAALLSSCGATPAGYTLCGLRLHDAADVAPLRTMERVALESIERNAGVPAHRLCHALWDFDVELREHTWTWTKEACRCEVPPQVYGETNMNTHAIALARQPRWSAVYLTHELSHVAQWGMERVADVQHATWEERGYWRAVSEAKETLEGMDL